MREPWSSIAVRCDLDEPALIDMQLLQKRGLIIDGLKQILVVFDHLAAHVDAQPLLVSVQLIAIEHIPQWQAPLGEQSRQVHGTLEAQRDRLKIR